MPFALVPLRLTISLLPQFEYKFAGRKREKEKEINWIERKRGGERNREKLIPRYMMLTCTQKSIVKDPCMK